MKIPSIVKLSAIERKNLLDEFEKDSLPDSKKKIVSDALIFIDSLIEEIKTSKVSIHKLKELLGFRSELLKKVIQSR
jgi:hypothetical protein